MVTAWSIEATGGPKCYPGRDMFEAHKHLGLTEYKFDVTAHEIRNMLYQLAVPHDMRKSCQPFLMLQEN